MACLLALSGSAGLAGFATASPTGATPSLGHALRPGRLAPAGAGGRFPARAGAGSPTTRDRRRASPPRPGRAGKLRPRGLDPGLPVYRRYLRPGAFAARFGATTSTFRATVTALRHLGLHVVSVSSNHLIIKVSSTVATVERAFHTKLQRYRLGSGTQVYANVRRPACRPRLPAASRRSSASTTWPVEPRRTSSAPCAAPRSGRASSTGAGRDAVPGGPEPCRQATNEASSSGPYTADEIASAYGFSGLYAAGDFGAGETVAVFELEPFSEPDVGPTTSAISARPRAWPWRRRPSLNVISVDGPRSGLGADEDVESTLDVEEISGFVPRATDRRLRGAEHQHRPARCLQRDRHPGQRQGDHDLMGRLRGTSTAAAPSSLPRPTCSRRRRPRARPSWRPPATTARPTAPTPAATRSRRRGRRPRQPALCDERRRHLDRQPRLAAGAQHPGVPDRGGLEHRRRRRRRRHLLRLGDAGLPVGRLARARGDQDATPRASRAARRPATAARSPTSRPTPTRTPALSSTGAPGAAGARSGGTSIAAPHVGGAGRARRRLAVLAATQPVGFLNPALVLDRGHGPSEYASAFNDVTRGDNHLAAVRQLVAVPGYRRIRPRLGARDPHAANPSGGGLVAQLCALPESGGVLYASPTKSSITRRARPGSRPTAAPRLGSRSPSHRARLANRPQARDPCRRPRLHRTRPRPRSSR